MVRNLHEGYSRSQYNSFELKNPLHKYASYNALFTLSGITENELREGAYLTKPLHDVIARTGGIGPEGVRSSYRRDEIEALQGVNPAVDRFASDQNRRTCLLYTSPSPRD